MAVTPGLPKRGEKRYQSFLDGELVDIALFHDGNQSGNVSKPIRAVDTTTDTIEVSNDIKDTTGDFGFLVDGQAFDISGSTGNDGAFTVASSNFNPATERTEITVNESIDDSTADGEAQFGNTNSSGRGDNLQDSANVEDITTEPDDGGYTRAFDQELEIFDDGEDFFIRTATDTVFDNLTDTTGRVDAVAVILNWDDTLADGVSNPQDNLLFTAFLDQQYLLDQTDRHVVQANTIRLAIR